MNLFVDSARPEDVRRAMGLGYVDGVTMNASLLAQQAEALPDLVQELCSLVPGTVSVPVRSREYEAILEEARELAHLDDNVLVKIPVHADGLRAMARLHHEGIRTHATLCCTPAQALVAARCGAYYVSPFLGRLDRAGNPGVETISQIVEIYDQYDFDTRVMVASVRDVMQVQEVAVLGVDACTMALELLESLQRHPLSDSLLEEERLAWTRS